LGQKYIFGLKKEHHFFSHINDQILGLTDNGLSFPFFHFWKKKNPCGAFLYGPGVGLGLPGP